MFMKLQIQLSQSDIHRAAMVRDGLDPKLMGMRRGTQVQRDRKFEAKRGLTKHKGRAFD